MLFAETLKLFCCGNCLKQMLPLITFKSYLLFYFLVLFMMVMLMIVCLQPWSNSVANIPSENELREVIYSCFFLKHFRDMHFTWGNWKETMVKFKPTTPEWDYECMLFNSIIYSNFDCQITLLSVFCIQKSICFYIWTEVLSCTVRYIFLLKFDHMIGWWQCVWGCIHRFLSVDTLLPAYLLQLI